MGGVIIRSAECARAEASYLSISNRMEKASWRSCLCGGPGGRMSGERRREKMKGYNAMIKWHSIVVDLLEQLKVAELMEKIEINDEQKEIARNGRLELIGQIIKAAMITEEDQLELPPKSRKRRIYLGDHQSKQLELAAMLNEVCLIETKVKDFADDATMAHLREEKEDLTKRLAQALQIPQA